MIKKILSQKSETETYEDAYIGMGQEIKAMSNSIYRKKNIEILPLFHDRPCFKPERAYAIIIDEKNIMHIATMGALISDILSGYYNLMDALISDILSEYYNLIGLNSNLKNL